MALFEERPHPGPELPRAAVLLPRPHPRSGIGWTDRIRTGTAVRRARGASPRPGRRGTFRVSLVLGILLLSVGCHKDTPPEPPDVVLHDRLRLLAGPRALDCGRATTDPENVEQTACAMDAIAGSRPFFVQYRLGGALDSTEQGLALNAAGVLSEASTVALNSPSMATARIDMRTCSPGSLHTSILGYLAC